MPPLLVVPVLLVVGLCCSGSMRCYPGTLDALDMLCDPNRCGMQMPGAGGTKPGINHLNKIWIIILLNYTL